MSLNLEVYARVCVGSKCVHVCSCMSGVYLCTCVLVYVWGGVYMCVLVYVWGLGVYMCARACVVSMCTCVLVHVWCLGLYMCARVGVGSRCVHVCLCMCGV